MFGGAEGNSGLLLNALIKSRVFDATIRMLIDSEMILLLDIDRSKSVNWLSPQFCKRD